MGRADRRRGDQRGDKVFATGKGKTPSLSSPVEKKKQGREKKEGPVGAGDGQSGA